MGKAKRFNTYDETVKSARERSKGFGQARQNLSGIGSTFRSSPLPPIITTRTSSSQAVATPNEFADNLFRIFDDFDPSSKLSFNVDGVFTGNTVTWFVPNASGIVCLLDSGFTQLFEDNIKFIGASTGLEMNGRFINLDVDGDSQLGVIFDNIYTLKLGGVLTQVIQTTPPRVDVFLKKIENVLDPVLDLDAVNLRTLNQKIAEIVSEFHDIIKIQEGIFESVTLPTPNVQRSNSITQTVSLPEPNVKRPNPLSITETVTISVVTP